MNAIVYSNSKSLILFVNAVIEIVCVSYFRICNNLCKVALLYTTVKLYTITFLTYLFLVSPFRYTLLLKTNQTILKKTKLLFRIDMLQKPVYKIPHLIDTEINHISSNANKYIKINVNYSSYTLNKYSTVVNILKNNANASVNSFLNIKNLVKNSVSEVVNKIIHCCFLMLINFSSYKLFNKKFLKSVSIYSYLLSLLNITTSLYTIFCKKINCSYNILSYVFTAFYDSRFNCVMLFNKKIDKVGYLSVPCFSLFYKSCSLELKQSNIFYKKQFY
jgi:uncharacterized protein YlzI (FlbEa/FlbD family)